jgi:hypothetical protein
LLIGDTLINGDDYVVALGFSGDKKFSISEPCEAGVTGLIAFVTGKRMAQTFVDALIE